jgi:hypothetical protein
MMSRKIQITETERGRIHGLYGVSPMNENVVITDWLSPDERYCIFLDELYDIENKIKIGNIWENFDNFKFFLKHSFEVATDIPQQIKESVLESINSFVLTESTQNMVLLKPHLKQILNENVISDFGNWVKDTTVGAVKGVGDFLKTGYEGLKKLGISISEGDWKNVVNLLKKGTLYVARKIRSAMYNPIGVILDAILLATGIGKSVLFVVWSVVVGLDIYELISGNYEDPDLAMGWRLLFLGVDILGLVFAGGVAKSGKGIVRMMINKFGKSSQGFSKALSSSKQLQGISQKIITSLNGAGSLIQRASQYLQKNSPKIFTFLSGSFKMFSNFAKKIMDILSAPGKKLKSTLGGGKLGTGAQTALNVGGLTAGIGTYQKGKESSVEQDYIKLFSNSNVEFDGI